MDAVSPEAAAAYAFDRFLSRLENPSGSIPSELKPYRASPLWYVLDRLPWGTGPLKGHLGPDTWQLEVLSAMEGLTPAEALQLAVSSGHGVGKSALVAWVICWAIDTGFDCRGVVTANTETQLRGKTWAELSKWARLFESFLSRFEVTATAVYSRLPGHDRTWRIDCVPWSEARPEAFAGLHNQGKRILLVFDEASAIPKTIWETARGALTDADTEIIWLVFGNPTRLDGEFHAACFGSQRHRWKTWCIDSRLSRIANQALLREWIEDYGEDSDFVRVRVRGLPPRAAMGQFIPADWVEAARKRPEWYVQEDPLIAALDVARGGDDSSVLGWRRGRSAKILPWSRWSGEFSRDSMKLAAAVAHRLNDYRPDVIFVDATGVGGPVGDRLRQLGHNAIDVQFGASALNPKRYRNRRSEMWGLGKEWLKESGAIPDDDLLAGDLTAPEAWDDDADRLVLERKQDIKARLGRSPDDGDALMLTFAEPVAQRQTGRETEASGGLVKVDYDPFAR